MSTVHETAGMINSLHCNCGATWTFKDGALEYKAGKAIATEESSATQEPKREWVTLEPQDMPGGEDPMYDHPFFIAGMVWAANKLKKKNT